MNSPLTKKAFALNDKSVLITLRFLVIIVCAFLVMYGFDANKVYSLKPLILIFSLYALSNVAFIFIDRRYFSLRWFRISLFMLDLVLISLLIYFSHGIDSDLYLVYFLMIFMAGGRNSIGHAFVMTIVVVVVYGALVSLRGGEISLNNTVLLLRIPFFFIISFIFLYYSDAERRAAEKQVAHMERLSALGEMLAAVLHEIRNPLCVLLGYSGELRKEHDEAERQKLWENIVSASEKTSRIIKNIMDYVRLGEAPERLLLNVNDVVESALSLTGEQLVFDNISVRKDLGPDMPAVSGNAQSLEQVLINILENARHALVSQRENRAKEIRISTSYKRKTVIIEISDNGPGIKKGEIDRLFEPFFTTYAEGTGLGLSLSYKIVRQHGGMIHARSEYDKGAVFTVELPSADVPHSK
ncbi:MAG: ATP-binding protein [Elusimicrobiota bacterium]